MWDSSSLRTGIPAHSRRAKRSEAFLYRRLETLPETRERFEVNADLPIAFDGGAGWKSIYCALIRASSLK